MGEKKAEGAKRDLCRVSAVPDAFDSRFLYDEKRERKKDAESVGNRLPMGMGNIVAGFDRIACFWSCSYGIMGDAGNKRLQRQDGYGHRNPSPHGKTPKRITAGIPDNKAGCPRCKKLR